MLSKMNISLTTLALIALISVEPCFSVLDGRRHRWRLAGETEDAGGHLVTSLPGQPEVSFKHYAGYVTVDEKNGRAVLFYWFYEATSQPDQKPLVLWLNGGPGCSSVGYGATQEIGPFIVDTKGHGLKYNPFAWNREANILFLESPAGVGFSYSNTTSDYTNPDDESTANDSYEFLHRWFSIFPSYRNRTFYIAGESYAGKYVPQLAELIQDKNKDPSLYINLKGIMLGNPEANDADDWRGMVDYAWSHAVISDETYSMIAQNCNFDKDDTWDNRNCSQAVEELLKQYKEIDMYSLYTALCNNDGSTTTSSQSTQIMFTRRSNMMPRILGGYDPCLDGYAKVFYNKPEVQKALHVSDGHQVKNWSICNDQIYHAWKYQLPSIVPVYKKLIAAGLRIWIYSGDTDGRVPVLSTRYSIRSIGLPITKAWTPWYHQKQVGGWFQEYEGLTFATVRGAGHAVPVFKPSESLALFSAFLRGESLPATR